MRPPGHPQHHPIPPRNTGVFVYGFAKSDRENIEDDELEKFKILAKAWFALSDKQIEAMTRDKALTEVKHEEK